MACPCHDPAILGHTQCPLAPPGGTDPGAWRAVPKLHDPQPRPDPDGMTWAGIAWTR